MYFMYTWVYFSEHTFINLSFVELKKSLYAIFSQFGVILTFWLKNP